MQDLRELTGIETAEWLNIVDTLNLNSLVASYMIAHPQEVQRYGMEAWREFSLLIERCFMIEDLKPEVREQEGYGSDFKIDSVEALRKCAYEYRLGENFLNLEKMDNWSEFIKEINHSRSLLTPQEYLRLEREETDKLNRLAPSTITCNYYLMRRFWEVAKTVDDYTDAIAVFIRFIDAKDDLPREELAEIAAEFLGENAMKKYDPYSLSQNAKFENLIAPFLSYA